MKIRDSGFVFSGQYVTPKNVLILLGAIAQSLAICLHAPSLDPVPSGAWVVVFSGHRPFSRSKSRRADRPEGADRAGARKVSGRSTPEQNPEAETAKQVEGLCVALLSTPFNHGRDTASPRSRSRARAAPWITAAAHTPKKKGAMDGRTQLPTSPRIRSKRIFKTKRQKHENALSGAVI